MTFLLEFPLYNDDTQAYIDGDFGEFQLIFEGKDLSSDFANLRTKDEVSYVLDHSPKYNSTLLEIVKVLDYDKKDDGELPDDTERKENLSIMNVLKQLVKEKPTKKG